MEPQQAAQPIVRSLAREGAAALYRVMEHIRLHQGQLNAPLGEFGQIGEGARGALHRAVQAVTIALVVEQAADGAPRGVVDTIERPRAYGDIGGGGQKGLGQHGRQPGEGDA